MKPRKFIDYSAHDAYMISSNEIVNIMTSTYRNLLTNRMIGENNVDWTDVEKINDIKTSLKTLVQQMMTKIVVDNYEV